MDVLKKIFKFFAPIIIVIGAIVHFVKYAGYKVMNKVLWKRVEELEQQNGEYLNELCKRRYEDD